VPQVDQVATRTFTYKATNAKGLESSAATVTISVTTAEDIPSPSAPAAPVTASGLTEIDLGALTTDPDSNFVTVLVESLPVHGTLYYDNDAGMTNPVSKFDPFAAMAVTEQFASQIVETSTFWPSPIRPLARRTFPLMETPSRPSPSTAAPAAERLAATPS